MTAYQEYWLSMAAIIIGCLGIGFAIGCMVMSRKAVRMIEGDVDTGIEHYRCVLCGHRIVGEIPPGLKGRFTHVRCERRGSDAILNARVID